MINLRVYIEICGVQTFVGTISGTDTANAVLHIPRSIWQ